MIKKTKTKTKTKATAKKNYNPGERRYLIL
jgi:hypothetical protein